MLFAHHSIQGNLTAGTWPRYPDALQHYFFLFFNQCFQHALSFTRHTRISYQNSKSKWPYR